MTTLLFAGDSVTDCGRTFVDADVAAGQLGDGWVRVVAAVAGHRRPGRDRVLNAGVAGDRVADLADRWDHDVVPHRPEVLTVLIGVNDAWWDPPTPPDEVERTYRAMLDRVPDSVRTLVLAEPFALPVDHGTELVRGLVAPTVELVRLLAAETGAVHLPLAERFEAACRQADPSWWAPDGVHPTAAGHGLIAETWLELVADRLD